MRRMFSILTVAALMAVAVGAAAALTVDGGQLQAGQDTVATCDTDGVAVSSWGTEADDGLVYFVRIGGIADACIGEDLIVGLSGASGPLGTGGPVSIPDGEFDDNETKVSFVPAVSAEAITDVRVIIETP